MAQQNEAHHTHTEQPSQPPAGHSATAGHRSQEGQQQRQVGARNCGQMGQSSDLEPVDQSARHRRGVADDQGRHQGAWLRVEVGGTGSQSGSDPLDRGVERRRRCHDDRWFPGPHHDRYRLTGLGLSQPDGGPHPGSRGEGRPRRHRTAAGTHPDHRGAAQSFTAHLDALQPSAARPPRRTDALSLADPCCAGHRQLGHTDRLLLREPGQRVVSARPPSRPSDQHAGQHDQGDRGERP